jgi:hypothetical protein
MISHLSVKIKEESIVNVIDKKNRVGGKEDLKNESLTKI